jgi:hypothetical protein
LAESWSKVATILLKRYGIEAPPDDFWWQAVDPWTTNQWYRWTPWTTVLGRVRLGDLPGHSLTVILHAVGWSGLAARYFAPALRTRPFTSLCLLLIAFGIFHEISVALWLGHPVRSWAMALRNTFAELKKIGPENTSADDPDVPAGGSLS